MLAAVKATMEKCHEPRRAILPPKRRFALQDLLSSDIILS